MIKKLFCALALVLCVGVSANAQDETKKNQFVIYAGPQLSTANGGASLSGKFSYLAGFQYERNGVFGDAFGLFGGLEYSAKGIKDYTLIESGSYRSMEDSYDLNYLQLNIGVKYAKEIWGIDGFAEVGPYLAYGIGGDAKCDGMTMDEGSFGDWEGRTTGGVGFKRFDFGFNIAIGAEFSGFRVMAGYQQGLTDIAGERLADAYKNYGFYAKVGYAF